MLDPSFDNARRSKLPLTDIGYRMDLARAYRGMELRELVRRSGVSYSYINEIRRHGHKSPGVKILVWIAEALGVNKAWLVFGEGAPGWEKDIA